MAAPKGNLVARHARPIVRQPRQTRDYSLPCANELPAAPSAMLVVTVPCKGCPPTQCCGAGGASSGGGASGSSQGLS